MEAASVIARNVAVVRPDAVSATITAIVKVRLVDERAPTADKAKALFCGTPEVQHCYHVTGGVSLIPGIAVQANC